MTYPLFPQKSPGYRDDGKVGYIPDQGLINAVNVALMLGQPLLLTGEPGVGKSCLAEYLAYDFDLNKPLVFETKSTSNARDLFYTYDALGRFHAKNSDANNAHSAEHYVHLNALGKAILLSNPQQPLATLLNNPTTAQRSVVLIDEVDKAPRDFPNDILTEIERLYFRIPELNNQRISLTDDNNHLRPIIILTSNSEKDLPDAFLRRCVFYNIPFPDKTTLTQIITAHLQDHVQGHDQFLQDVLEIFKRLRDPSNALTKKPTTAELLAWLKVLRASDSENTNPIRHRPELLNNTFSALIKTVNDQLKADEIVKQWITEQQL